MLVKLYTLPDIAPALEACRAAGVTIRRGIAPEKHYVMEWVREKFGNGWASETDVAYGSRPPTCFVATVETGDPYRPQLVGFACYDATMKAFFGPTGVDEAFRGRGIGRALLLACLHGLRADGYGYGIIGGAGPVDFYRKSVGAVEIPDSWPGVYTGLLRE
jgi:ribosomal protein S18 acetylase RimI-like enzyme